MQMGIYLTVLGKEKLMRMRRSVIDINKSFRNAISPYAPICKTNQNIFIFLYEEDYHQHNQ